MYIQQPKRTIDFNTEPILNDIDNIVKDGLTKLLGQYLNRYELLERTHQAIMNLPSVMHELANRTESHNFSSPVVEEKQNEKDLQAMISANENLLARVDILSKENEELTNELRELKKQLFKDTIDLSFDEVQIKVETLVPGEPVNIDYGEKENIRLEIEEQDVPDEDEDEEEDVEEIPAGTKLGGKTWDGDDWQTDDEYEDDEDDVDEDETDEADKTDIQEAVVDEPELQEDSVEEDDVEEDDVEEAEESVEEDEQDVAEDDEQDEEVEENEESVETEKSDSEEEQEVEADEDEDIFEIDIDDVTYCTNNEENGFIYELKDGEMGDKIGYFKDGEPFFYADEN